MFKVNNEVPGVFFSDFYWPIFFSFFYVHRIILFCLKLNLSMCIRVKTRSTAKFKTKLYETTAEEQFPAITYFLSQSPPSKDVAHSLNLIL